MRGNLRHYFQPYGVQQLRKFFNARKREKANQSAFFFRTLLFAVKRQMNKEWARLVPAAAVIPALQVAATFIRSKTFVARRKSFLLNVKA